jgi:methyl-accepting chemotaxis protein
MLKRWLGNLRLLQKFMVIAIVALLVAAVPLTLFVRSEWRQIDAARSETTGIAPAAAVLKAIQLLQAHRGLSNAVLAGNKAMGDARATKSKETADALSKLLALLAPFAAAVRDDGDGVARAWPALARSVETQTIAPPDSFAQHTALIAKLLGLLQAIGEETGMSLDADAANNALVHAVLLHLPELTEVLGQARARGAALLTRGDGAAADRAKLAAAMDLAQLHTRNAQHALQVALRSDAALSRTLERPLADARQAAEQMIKLVNEELVRADKSQLAPAEYFRLATTYIDAQFALSDPAFQKMAERLQARVDAAMRALGAVLAVLAVGLAAALWLMWTLARIMSRATEQALAATEAMAAGDLTARDLTARDSATDLRDEMGQVLRALADTRASLSGTVTDIRAATESVSTASVQIARGNLDLSSRTEEQASNLQQSAASIEQVSAAMRQNADHAKEANALAHNAAQVAARGGQVVSEVVERMNDITASSKEIAEIVGVIDSIAFQTNILALNAAVEAARAGDQGRGFAVVASEVRALAQRSAQAAREIKTLIGNSVARIEGGSELVSAAGKTMQEIVTQVHAVTDLIGKISAATEEQTSGITQINEAVAQLDHVTQQNAALVEESAAAADSLKDQAARLARAVGTFKLEHRVAC